MTADTVLITGASSGIGEELARNFARDGYKLVLVARSRDKLKQLAAELADSSGAEAAVEVADLSRRGAAEKLAARLHEKGISVDILVNNAGVLEHGYFADIDPALHRGMLDLNICGLTEMLQAFLPPMLERGSGRILNVASTGAFQPIPGLATYAATKAYVLSLTESLAEEVKGKGISVTALCPGVTATAMVSGAQEKSHGLQQIPDFLIGDVEEVAKTGYRACMQGEVICVPGAVNLASTLAMRTMPRWLVRRLTGVLGRYAADAD